MQIDRRTFMQLAGVAGVTLAVPQVFAEAARSNRVVILVELSGGNDGLNTVVPHDPLYQRLRPTLALPPSELRGIDRETSLHASLEQLAEAWDDGELAIVEGLGYAEPNRSHFRSIEIWDTGTSATDFSDRGWVAKAAPSARLQNSTLAALTTGGGGDGPLSGIGTLDVQDPDQLFRLARRLTPQVPGSTNPALAHVLRTQNELLDSVARVQRHIAAAPSFDKQFRGNRQLRPMQVAAELVASRLPLMAVKIRVPGFDTHVNQRAKHARLLQIVDQGIASFRSAMKSAGMWNDVLIVTYSEFGRRPRENGGGGTDHGTAAPHFVLGGNVRGGRYGVRPSLESLDDNGDLRFTTDYRRLYSTVAERCWGANGQELGEFPAMDFI